VKKEDDPNSRERPCGYREGLAEIREKSNTLKANWKKEKDLIVVFVRSKSRLKKLKLEEQTELRKGNNERVAELRFGLIPQAEQELSRLSKQMESQGSKRMLKEEVDEEDIAASSPSGRESPSRRC